MAPPQVPGGCNRKLSCTEKQRGRVQIILGNIAERLNRKCFKVCVYCILANSYNSINAHDFDIHNDYTTPFPKCPRSFITAPPLCGGVVERYQVALSGPRDHSQQYSSNWACSSDTRAQGCRDTQALRCF